MIFEGLDDLMMEASRAERWADRITRYVLIVSACVMIAVIVLLLSFGNARAQNQPQSCSGTVSGTATNITFGHAPTQFVFICNPSATATLWLSTTTTAAANSSGSFALGTTGAGATSGCVTLTAMPTVSIIASASSTPYTCFYR